LANPLPTVETDKPFHDSFDSGTAGAFGDNWGINFSTSGQVTLSAISGMKEWGLGPSSGHGYGTYTIDAKFDGLYGGFNGSALILWPGDNKWPGQELNLAETFPNGTGQQYGTVHWVDAGGNDQTEIRVFPNVTAGVFHQYRLVWQPNQITFLVDGVVTGFVTDHVPLDYDAGGMNNTIGFINQGYNTSLTVRDVDYQPLGLGPITPIVADPSLNTPPDWNALASQTSTTPVVTPPPTTVTDPTPVVVPPPVTDPTPVVVPPPPVTDPTPVMVTPPPTTVTDPTPVMVTSPPTTVTDPTPVQVAVSRDGVSSWETPTTYAGPVTYLQTQFLGTSGGEAVVGTPGNDFISLLGGDDAANGGAGNDVLDGGLGSNFLTGGAGSDVFFLDGRGGQTTWSTITDWQAGEQLSLWGWRPGVSHATWVDRAGTAGFEGATLHADLDGNGSIDASVTWTGMTKAQLPTPIEMDGLLWIK